MKIKFAAYEHSRVGFPKVVLKWFVEDGKVTDSYVVVDGVITTGKWGWYNPNPTAFIDHECERFDRWVLEVYGKRADLQG